MPGKRRNEKKKPETGTKTTRAPHHTTHAQTPTSRRRSKLKALLVAREPVLGAGGAHRLDHGLRAARKDANEITDLAPPVELRKVLIIIGAACARD